MIAGTINRLRRWYRAFVLRADIAGYEDDLHTLRLLGMRGSKSEALILEAIAEAKAELYLCTRMASPAASITN